MMDIPRYGVTRTTVMLEKRRWRELRLIAAERHTTGSDLLRQLIEQFLVESATCR